MDNPLAFSATVPPAELAALLKSQGALVAGTALANLPNLVMAKVYAHLDEGFRTEAAQAAKLAKNAPPALLSGIAESIKAAMKNGAAAASAAPASVLDAPAAPPPSAPAGGTLPKAAQPNPYTAAGQRPGQRPASVGPVKWVPRPTSDTPINATPPASGGTVASSPSGAPPVPAASAAHQPQILGPRDALQPRPPSANPAARRIPPTTPANAAAARAPQILGPRDALSPRTNRPAPAPSPRRPVGNTPATPPSPVAGARQLDGMAVMAAILREANPEVRARLAQDDPSLFESLKRRMFIFDDFLRTEAPSLARIFGGAATDDITLALRFAPPQLAARVMAALGPRRAAELALALKQTVQGISLKAVEASQQRILDLALKLQRAGAVLIDPDDPDLIG